MKKDKCRKNGGANNNVQQKLREAVKGGRYDKEELKEDEREKINLRKVVYQ